MRRTGDRAIFDGFYAIPFAAGKDMASAQCWQDMPELC
jgi:hypothetical protein